MVNTCPSCNLDPKSWPFCSWTGRKHPPLLTEAKQRRVTEIWLSVGGTVVPPAEEVRVPPQPIMQEQERTRNQDQELAESEKDPTGVMALPPAEIITIED